jgi:general secretion pathway protein A
MYAEHFGFSDLPFSVTPDPRFFYTNPIYHEAFASLRYGIEARKGFILITGEVGTGKTTLLKIFMRSVESTVHTAFVFNPKLNFTELLRFSLNDLEIPDPSHDRLTLMEQLNDYLIKQHKRDHVVALLVDEAQDLSDPLLEELRLLSNFETDKDKLIQIVLMGQPELERRLDQPELRQLKQRIGIRCRLVPLGSHEVEPYINHRLKTVGYEGKGLFSPSAVERIILYSNGIPRLINVICDNGLLIAYASSKKNVSAEIIEEVADDLQLAPAAPHHRIHSTNGDWRAKSRDEIRENTVIRVEQEPGPEFELEEGLIRHPPNRTPVRLGTGMGMATALALFLLTAAMAVSFSQQTRDSFSEFGVRLGDFSQRSKEYLLDLSVKVEDASRRGEGHIADFALKTEDQSKNYISWVGAKVGDAYRQSRESLANLAAKANDFSSQSKNYIWTLGAKSGKAVSDSASRVGHFFGAQWRPEASEDKPSKPQLADARNAKLSQSTEPDGDSAPPAEKAAPVDQESKKAEQSKNLTPLSKPKKSSETKVAKNNVAPTERRLTSSDNSKAQAVEQDQQASVKNDLIPQPNPQKESRRPGFLGNFEVVEDSFVRDKPQTNAEITTTLRPGTWVYVESKNGEYFRIRSLNDPGVRGYVHEEDAFFARIK